MKDLDQLIEGAVSSRKKEKGTPLDLNTLLEMTSEVILENTQKGNDFEVVVVQTVRALSGANPLTGGPYEGWESKSQKTATGGKTLGEMAKELYTTASESGFFTLEDFQNAKMQDIGKSQAYEKGPKVEIKTDVFFGDKPISIKMPGDTQADSSKIAAIIPRVRSVMAGGKNQDIDPKVETKVETEVEKEFKETLAKLENKIINMSKNRYLGDGRVPSLEKTIANSKDPKAVEKAQQIINTLKKLEIIDDTASVIREEFSFNKEEVSETIQNFLKMSLEGDLRALVKELLTGARAFEKVPGAAAQYLLSPDYAFDLNDERSIDVLSAAIKMRIAIKSGGRKLNIEEIDSIKKIGAELTLRWDIKSNLLKSLIESLKQEDGQERAAVRKPPTPSATEEKSFKGIYDDIQDTLLSSVKNKNSK